MRRFLLLATLLALLCFAAAALREEEKGQYKEEKILYKSKDNARATGEILYDTWGVPHIFAESFEALSYGYGYAQARDHGRLLVQLMFISSGRAAELGGILYTAVDRFIYASRIRQVADEFYYKQHPESIVAFDNFAAGFNAYAAEHPDEFDGTFGLVLPVSGVDLFRANLRVLYTFTFSGSSSFSIEFVKEFGINPLQHRSKDGVTYAVDEDLDTFRFMEVPEELRHMIGSNAWAINSKSGRSDGKPKLNQNPHLPYFVFFRWYEAQLTCVPCDIDVYGASLVGIPNLQIAFNDYLGWTHTVNPHRAYTGYVVDLVDDDTYLFDGQTHKITREEVSFKVKLPIGSRTETVINEFTLHGQVISRAEGKVLVKRLAGIDDEVRPDAVKQWWDMGRAKNLAEFKDAMRQLQVPMFYTVVTTRDDDILFNFNGWVPKRKFGDFNYWNQAVNGSTSETFWETVHPWDELPTLENPESGYVQNANEPPWSASLPINTLNYNDYPAYIAPAPSMSYRPQVSARTISTNYNITFDQFVAMKHTTLKEATNHALDDLLSAVEAYGQSQEAFDGAAVLAAWDRHMETTSRGSDLFEEWLRLSPATSLLYVNQWDTKDPLNTPNTLADPRRAVEDLETAVRNMRLRGVEIDSEYGANNRFFAGPYRPPFETVPGNGCSDCFRSSYFYFGVSGGGDSWVSIIEWDENGAHAKSLIGYGNASPGTGGAVRFGHIHDQNTLFSRKELRDVWRTRSEIMEHLEERHVIDLTQN